LALEGERDNYSNRQTRGAIAAVLSATAVQVKEVLPSLPKARWWLCCRLDSILHMRAFSLAAVAGFLLALVVPLRIIQFAPPRYKIEKGMTVEEVERAMGRAPDWSGGIRCGAPGCLIVTSATWEREGVFVQFRSGVEHVTYQRFPAA